MKAIWLALSITLFVAGTLECGAQSQPPEIPFDSVPDFLQLPPDLYFGEVAGIAVNSKGHVFVLSRGNTTGPAYGAAAAQLLEFGPDGKFLREIGHNLYAWSYAHAVRVDRDDNVWVADKGSDVVVRFSPQGRVTMVFGRKAEAADENAHPLEHPKPPRAPIDGMFRQVTDMTWDSAGNVYISDGYINSRVAKFDREGNWVGTWGEPGSGPGQFNTLHAIVTDRRDRIYVADRGNAESRCSTPPAKCFPFCKSTCLPRRTRASRSVIDPPKPVQRQPGMAHCVQARLGRCASRQARPNTFTSQTRSPAVSTK